MKIFDIINVPLGYIIKICYQLTDNYLLALLLFSLVLQILLLPFAIKQQKNSIKQAKLDPKVRAIRKKYAGRTDQATQQKMNNEVMELYQRENFNPMGGCLPLLIQMPILFALYNVVVNPLKYICSMGTDVIANIQAKVYELMSAAQMEGFEAFAADKAVRQIDLIKKMRTLGEANFDEIIGGVTEEILPNFTVLGLDLSARPVDELWPLIIVPALTLVFTLASQWITKKFSYNPNPEQQKDMSMKIMQWSMPALSVYIAFTIEATIGSYWIFRNILSTIQTVILAKVMPIPRFTEEDYKAAEKEVGVKASKKEKKEQKKVRSLHRIDEDDDEEIIESTAKESDKPELKDGVKEEDAPKLKDESDRKTKDDTDGE